MPIRKAEMNSKIKGEDKLRIKSNIFISTFVLFNASIATLYASLRSKQAMRSIKIPVALACFALLAYKLEVEWISREIIRKCELSSSDIAYFMRKQMLEECGEHPFVKSRAKILRAKNGEYEHLYKIE
jgi:hypothetical protein